MIQQQKLPNGFNYIKIKNKNATAKVALQGGHLFHFQLHGQKPLLWVSPKSHFENGKAIRGGIPICWPWFGKNSQEASLPQHGFARTSEFTFLQGNEPDQYNSELVLQLKSSATTTGLWPYHCKLQLRITIGSSLRIALTTSNCDTRPFTISSALHSYFSVSDIKNISIQGLNNLEYWDNLTEEYKKQAEVLRIDREVDRIYQGTDNPLILQDKNRTLTVSATGSSSAVIWNPWKDKSIQMADMTDDAYTTMLCVETANARDDAREIFPDRQHTLQAEIG